MQNVILNKAVLEKTIPVQSIMAGGDHRILILEFKKTATSPHTHIHNGDLYSAARPSVEEMVWLPYDAIRNI